MHDAPIVSELQRLTNRRHDRQCLLRSQPPGLHRLPQADAVHELHQQEIEFFCLARPAKIMHRDDVGMTDFGKHLPLAREPLREVRILRVLRSQNLQRHKPPQRFLSRFVDGTHASLPDQLNDLKLRKRAGQFCDGWRSPRHRGKAIGSRSERCLLQQTRRTNSIRDRRFQISAATRAFRISYFRHGHPRLRSNSDHIKYALST